MEGYTDKRQTTYWIENETFSVVEIAIRFQHKIVQVHPFPNGNGRMARMAADLFLEIRKVEPPTWGRGSLTENSKVREDYLEALREADRGNYGKLLDFAKR